MKVLKAESKNGGIYVEAEILDEVRKYRFELNDSDEYIKGELNKCEETLKKEREDKEKNKEKDELEGKATNTINNLLK